MMMLRPATLSDANIRPRDWELAMCPNPEPLIREWIEHSTPCWAAYDETVPLYAVFGVLPRNLMARSAMIWLVASEEAAGYWGDFALTARRFVEETKERFDELYGPVWLEQPKAVRFVHWLGFDVAPAGNGTGVFWWRRA